MRAWNRCFFHHRSRQKGRELWLAGLLGIFLAACFIIGLDLRLRPVVETMAEARVSNAVITLLDQAVTTEIQSKAITYSDLITIEKDENGCITALTSNMAALNDLRTSVLIDAVAAVDQIDAQSLAIPVGNLTGINFLSGRGFDLPVEVMTVGSAHAEYQSQFSDAGINQTRHQIQLEVTVSLDILLPGGDLPTEVSTQVLVAETVIVGSVPDAYVDLSTYSKW